MLHPTLDGTVTAVVKSKYLEHHLLHFPVFFPIFDHKDMLSDCKGIQTRNLLVLKRTFNRLAKRTK